LKKGISEIFIAYVMICLMRIAFYANKLLIL